MILVDRLDLIIFALIFSMVGGLISWISTTLKWRAQEGYSGFGENTVVKASIDDVRVKYGINIGVLAGYYAATGEERDLEYVVGKYQERLEEEKES